MSLFTALGISAGYGGVEIVKDISFSLQSGELVGILGANGSGKTTLLKALCGVLPHTGSCILGDTTLELLPPKKLAALCGYIPQRSGISIDITALDVVLMGFNPQLGLLERPTAAMIAAAKNALTQVGLGDKMEENYLHLSEGQKQLCILARTLAADRQLLLLDEPESALDFRFRYQMLDLIRLWLRQGQRCGMVTLHDPVLALNGCDRLLLLSEGRLAGTLCPEGDSLEEMEAQLGMLYGNISLCRCQNRAGKSQLVMLKETEP